MCRGATGGSQLGRPATVSPSDSRVLETWLALSRPMPRDAVAQSVLRVARQQIRGVAAATLELGRAQIYRPMSMAGALSWWRLRWLSSEQVSSPRPSMVLMNTWMLTMPSSNAEMSAHSTVLCSKLFMRGRRLPVESVGFAIEDFRRPLLVH